MSALPKPVLQEEEPRPRLKDMRQGERVSPVFSQAEFDRRITALRKYMEQEDLGAVVITSYQNINYFSGFLYCQFSRQFGLIVTQDTSTLVVPAVDGGQPWRRSPGAENVLTYTDWYRDNFFWVISRLLAHTRGKVGLELDHVSVDSMKKFDTAISNKIQDISRALMKTRMVKSAEEIALTREGCRIAEMGGRAAMNACKEGAAEHEIALASTGTMIKEIAKTFPDVESLDTWTWLQSGINTDGAHNPNTTRKLRNGDILSLNCFPMITGFYAALERTMFLGSVSDDHRHIWEINNEVHERGCEIIKPGMRVSDISVELDKTFRKYDLLKYRTIGYGHSFGFVCHYYGREADLELRDDIHTILEPGMIISMEPMLTIPEGHPGAGGYREHDTLVITEDGVDNLTKDFPRGPKQMLLPI